MESPPLAIARLQLGTAAVLSPSRAAELLPVRESEALRWLRERNLIRTVPGLGELVIWGDVVAALQAPVAPPESPKRGRLPRARL